MYEWLILGGLALLIAWIARRPGTSILGFVRMFLLILAGLWILVANLLYNA